MITTVGLIGEPVAHSVSPAFQNAAFRHYGLADQYVLWPTPLAELEDRVNKLRVEGMRGANVTLPHKMAVLPLLDELDAAAAAVEAVNTIVRDETGRLRGLNTDVPGFLRSLTTAGVDPTNTHCVMLGAGGAARAVAFALIDAGAQSLTIVNRTPERAEALLADVLAVIEHEPKLRFLGLNDSDLQHVIAEATILINATSVGLDKQTSPLSMEFIEPHLLVVDLIYGKTPLLEMAEQRGAQTQDGLEMLVQQGALAFEAWTGLDAPVDIMRIAAQQALEERT